jgi:tRNA-2-methylthio-N6-dimethylallyladenosine synthase
MKKNNVYIETYGCQMNLADTEIVMGILQNNGYGITKNVDDADIVLLNTCSVRENAEQRIYGRLGKFKTGTRCRHSWLYGRKAPKRSY